MSNHTNRLPQLVLAVSTEIEQARLTTQTLDGLMSSAFGGTSASGAWSWRMAYDVMEAGFVRCLMDTKPIRPIGRQFEMLEQMAAALPTQTRRSEGQIQLQQFSSPLPVAFIAGRAAQLREGDSVLEPSAGTGALALAPTKRRLTVHLNEIDPFRAALLELLFKATPSSHDAEHIDDLLDPSIAPDVVVMNPPFSSSGKRSADPTIAARHLVAAAKRLKPGGRLVAIMPDSFSATRTRSWWGKMQTLLSPRLAIVLPRSAFAKQGTSVTTQLLIADKCAPDGLPFHRVRAATLDVALDLVTREVPPRRPTSEGAATRSSPPPVPIAHKKQAVAKASSAPAKAQSSGGIGSVSYEVLATPRTNEAISEVYARYAPQRVAFAGAQTHPTPLVESLAMAAVTPPAPKGALRLPKNIIEDGTLSDAQIETILMAHIAHGDDLPGKFLVEMDTHGNPSGLTRADDPPDAVRYRKGAYLGDGTGCGKGRQVAGLILANWLEGRRKAIWISKSATLIEDAIRDWRDLGGAPTDIQSLGKWKPHEPVSMAHGILFVPYALLRAQGKTGVTRLEQILAWAGKEAGKDFEGVIAFDEAHAMANAAGSSEGRGRKPSQQGLAGLRLQIALPRARVFYVSATGATTVDNLAYAARLGLWGAGPDYPFSSREQFVASMEAGGVAAMEVVARDLKAMGLYTARALSFDGVEYDILEHALTPDQVTIYDTYATAFKTIHQNLQKALEATGIVDPDGAVQATASKASAMSIFESTKQRFFNHVLLGLKAPSVIKEIEADIAGGWAPVFQIVSTGESLLKRRLETMDAEELTSGSLTPRDYVIGYLQTAFPIHAQELVEIDGTVMAQPLRDETGDLVVSREALALRDGLIEDLMCLAPIPSALDQIIWHFGTDQVAEITGRSIRPVMTEDGTLKIEKRSASSNASETRDFMDGSKKILVFSDAGGTGRSYHAAQTARNQRRRRHYLLEPGWRADAAIQGLGRSHRAAQVSAPYFRVCTTNVHGEKRFTSTIARRLDTLGAITKGQRETGSQGMFRAEDNLESPVARRALRALYADLAADRANSMRLETFCDWTALSLKDKDGHMLEELPPIQRFLNRVLALPIDMQNALFAEFMEKIALQTERARAAGTLDVGIETLRADLIEETGREDIWTDPATGAITQIVALKITETITIPNAAEALDRWSDRTPMINMVSGKAALISARPFQVYDDDTLALMRRIARPNSGALLDEPKFLKSNWEQASKPAFVSAWNTEADALPRTLSRTIYLLTGLLLPIWTQIPAHDERIYRVTPHGGTSMIGRALSEDQAAVLRARFMTDTPKTAAEIVTKATGSSAPIDLGRGLTLQRRRVAGEMRLEIQGADRATISNLKAHGCFTEIIAFQLRVFVPVGDGVDTEAIIARIMGSADKSKAA